VDVPKFMIFHHLRLYLKDSNSKITKSFFQLKQAYPANSLSACIMWPSAMYVNYTYCKKLCNNLCSWVFHLLRFFTSGPVNQPTTTVVALSQKMVGHT
jgi:hypothetical protein